MVWNYKLHCRMSAFILIALLCGCANIETTSSNSDNSHLSPHFPQLPGGLFDRHGAAQLQSTSLEGADTLAHSPSAVPVGASLQLTAANNPSALEWAIWKLSVTEGTVPESATINLSVDEGASAWIGIADYGSNSWELSGPFDSSGAKVIAPLAAQNVSGGGNIFVMAAAYRGTQITVSSADFEIDVPAPPKYFITGSVSDSNLGTLPNVVVTLSPGNIQATTNDSGNYTFLDLDPGDYTVTPPHIDAHDVAPQALPINLNSGSFAGADFVYTQVNTGISYTNNIKLLLDTSCVQCHSPANPGREWLDVYIRGDSNDVFHNAEDSLEYIQSGLMPPGKPLNSSQKQMFQQWVQAYNKAE
jgi:hypothetical protein